MKALSLISGGLDSPVASYRMMKEMLVDFIFFYNEPFASEREKEIVISCVKVLKAADKRKRQIKLFIVPHGYTLSEVAKKCQRNLQCIICRRMMFRIASRIAENNGYRTLITGESLGQVASQTLDNLILEGSVSRIPILRPLLSFDKTEIVKIARRIGTYEFSKFHKCCGLTPIHPRTAGKKDEVEESEKNLDVEKIIKEAVENTEIIVI
jgi:thiamine biosynthesis protein ThiI